ncbi:hypothetical protein Taro_020535 [Colocasia esculenta]|uniref:NAC domain-containing protein n=1 Tax=Colocasia esculenta TaxID=4460 RepID=A0A843V2L7_COLES|nr:hypothetical protein [Colocasia esculenta]
MEVESCVPPGFRFHPTEEELVGYYLARKVASQKIDLEVITDIDLYRIEPWDLQDRCKHGHEDQNEWYFFSHKDKKYPTGTRTNRATAAGFWKATGRDKAVLSKNKIIGMRKTLVFYQGRAPNGRKSDWIMHEYRLQTSENAPPQEEGWVVCRAFRKQIPIQKQGYATAWSPAGFYPGNHDPFRLGAAADITRPTHFMDSYRGGNLHEQLFHGDQLGELECKQNHFSHLQLELPQLDSPSLSSSFPNRECFEPRINVNACSEDHDGRRGDCAGQFVDWKVLDKLLASQLNESASCPNTNLPSIPLHLDADIQQNQEDHFFAASCSRTL